MLRGKNLEGARTRCSVMQASRLKRAQDRRVQGALTLPIVQFGHHKRITILITEIL